MSPRRTRAARTPRPPHRHAGHGKAQCLKIFRRLSGYLDGELPGNICREIRKHLGDCKRCEVFLQSLRQTIALCRKYRARPLPPAARARLKSAILRAVGRA
jgi:anti-sigma factor RsiW